MGYRLAMAEGDTPVPDDALEAHAPSADAIYGALAARRTQFDNLLWQAPVLSLTAQAFLMTVALGSGVPLYSRTVACLLSIIVAFLSVHILTRHRQAEITDAHWLRDLEKRAAVEYRVHGPGWQKRRNATSPEAGPFNWFARLPGYYTWAIGLSLFGVASLVTLILAWVGPSLLA
ncbi:MAG TPA: hypothetical protein VIL51_04625 [Thermoleophilia bacterium]